MNVSFPEGALVDTAGITVHALRRVGITPGGTVAVIGPGPISLIAMRMARLLGAAKVLAFGRNPRLSLVGQSAGVCVDFEQQHPVEAVRDLTGGLGADEVFECSGAKGTFRQSVLMLKRGGKVGLLGVPSRDMMEELPFAYVVSNEISIFGSKADPHTAKHIVALVASGRLILKDLITHKFPLEEFGEALDTFVSRKDGAMKVVLEPNGS